MTTFDRIKKLCEDKGYNLQIVAEKLGFSKNIFYKWKTSSPKGADLQKVADYFEVSVDYLLGRTENPYPRSNPEDDFDDDFFSKERQMTVAAHIGDDVTDEEMEDIIKYIEFIKSKHRSE